MNTLSPRDADLTRKIADYWTWRADTFAFAKGDRAAWEAAIARALPPGTGLRVLDIGTGTGFFAAVAAHQGHRVWGIDLSEAMLAKARENLAREGVSAALAVGDARDPDFAEGFFDAVLCRNVLWTLPDPATAVAAWHRLLRPGGRIAVSDGMWQPGGLTRLARLVKRRLAYCLPGGSTVKVNRFETAYRSIKRSMPFFRGLDPAAATALLETAGFTDFRDLDDRFPNTPRRADPPYFFLGATKPKQG